MHPDTLSCDDFRRLQDWAGSMPGELEASILDAISAHRTHCAACTRLAENEERWTKAIRKVLFQVPTLGSQPGKIKVLIQSRLRRDRRRRVEKCFSVAAMLLLGCGLGMGVYQRTKAPPEESSYVEWSSPRSMLPEWMNGLEGTFMPPVQFNWDLLTALGHADFLPGKSAPTLIFVNNRANATAQLYMIKTSDWKAEDWQTTGSQRVAKLRYLTNPEQPEWMYVIVYTGPDLSVFLQRVDDV